MAAAMNQMDPDMVQTASKVLTFRGDKRPERARSEQETPPYSQHKIRLGAAPLRLSGHAGQVGTDAVGDLVGMSVFEGKEHHVVEPPGIRHRGGSWFCLAN